MIKNNNWEYLTTHSLSIVDVEFYYMLTEGENGIEAKIREEVCGWEELLGTYSTTAEAVEAVESYKEKVNRLAEFENELFSN